MNIGLNKLFITAKSIILIILSINILHIYPAYSNGVLPEECYISSNRIANIADNLEPSVVSIQTENEELIEFDIKGIPLDEDFFQKYFGGKSFPKGKLIPKKRKVRGNASGTIITPNGYILTNYHVVRDAKKIYATTKDGKKYDARIIGKDKFSDLAVIKIDAQCLQPAPLGDSCKIRAGDWAIAIGSPLGLGNTVTFGIISNINREVPLSNINFIQTDAAINPGNSGGPLLNINGEVIGINTAIAGRAQGIGFAIPINIAKEISDQLIVGKIIPRPWIGIAMSPLESEELAKSLGAPINTKGILINNVFPGSPADKAGLTQGDIIQRIDDKRIFEPKELQCVIRSMPLNSNVNIQFLRGSKMMGTKVKIIQWPDESAIDEE
ncbi:MAG: trypsin-like peptidase domain-containing protein [Candidatus Gastranaerophilales bacterium]|nr:trypsin-like peptidase domain-containing protein [Candidatus Gastranaerophilales bacterium]